MNWEKLPAGTEFNYTQTFYTVKNLKGGFALQPIIPGTPVQAILPPTDFFNRTMGTMKPPPKPDDMKDELE